MIISFQFVVCLFLDSRPRIGYLTLAPMMTVTTDYGRCVSQPNHLETRDLDLIHVTLHKLTFCHLSIPTQKENIKEIMSE